MAMLYGGIDSKELTDRAADPSGAMGAIQRILSNDVACKNVARDFARPPGERRLFPRIAWILRQPNWPLRLALARASLSLTPKLKTKAPSPANRVARPRSLFSPYARRGFAPGMLFLKLQRAAFKSRFFTQVK